MDLGKLNSVISNFDNIHILCLGDVMLDRFVYGSASRISPEAPIPVLGITHQQSMLGGAGNVIRNILSLGGQATLIALVGDDADGHEVESLLAKEQKLNSAIVNSGRRPTTVKTRFIADGQQLLRADAEVNHNVAEDTARRLLEEYEKALGSADVVILSDYAKGVLSDQVLKHAISLAKKANVPIIADPKSTDFSRYEGVTLLTPNRKEMIAASGHPCSSDSEVETAASHILSKLQINGLLITRSEAGMSLVTKAETAHIPAQAREVFDVSGAGDSVIACLSLAMGAGASVVDAAYLANLAGSIVVAKTGTAAVTQVELCASFNRVKSNQPITRFLLYPKQKKLLMGGGLAV
nr:D-glycero-beta-D-manno-heptose-7-phosphate kinase [Sneathiella glossodoripedis]